jgi:hypothetical protein
MRTKTLLLSALLGTVGSISAMSQSVYSINSVGYITLTLVPGYTMIADQLMATGGNAISNVMNDAGAQFDSIGIFQWNGHSYAVDQGDSAGSPYDNGWDNNGLITLNPGQGAWVLNENGPGGADVTVTFVGTVPQGTNAVNLAAGYNQMSSPAPIGGDLVTAAGLINFNDGDIVDAWNPATKSYTVYTADIAGGTEGYLQEWDPPGDPQVAVGQAVWYFAQAPIVFSQVFSVNQ